MSTTLEAPKQRPQPKPQPARKPTWLNAMLLRMHFFAGIFIGPFILIAALTGSLYAFAPQISDYVHRDTVKVAAQSTVQPLNTQVQAAQKAAGPKLKVTSVAPASDTYDTTKVVFRDASLPKGTRLGVFVNPHTAEVTGTMHVHGRGGSTPTQNWLSKFHRDLKLGDFGVWYSELAATWLGIVAIGGLVLWWRKRKNQRRVSSAPGASTRRIHGWIGVATAIPLVFLAATGVTWSDQSGKNIRELRTSMGWTGERLNTKLGSAKTAKPAAGGGEHAEHGGHDHSAKPAAKSTKRQPVDWDAAVTTARNAGLSYPALTIKPARKPGSAMSVAENGRQWPLQRDQIAINPANQKITDKVTFEEQHPVAKLVTWGILFHRGDLFGFANQLLLFVVGLTTVALTVMGYVMWWKRRPTKAAAWQPGRMYPRGSLRRAPLWATVLIIASAVGLGIFLPLLGWSLLLFVIVDLALAARQHFRNRALQTAS